MEFHRIVTDDIFDDSVLTIGTFDGIHRGHITLIRRVEQRAKTLQVPSVLITFDPHPKEILLREKKVPVELLTTKEEKKHILAQEFDLDHVYILPFTEQFSRVTARKFLAEYLIAPFSPSEIIIGYDHRFGKDRAGDGEFLRHHESEYGYATTIVDAESLEDGIAISSSGVRQALRRGDTLEAIRYLSRPYRLSGTVTHGAGRGKALQFPTANIAPATANKLLPGDGIYLVYVTGEEVESYGLCSIGDRPTFDDGRHTVEVYLLDPPEQSLYGHRLTLYFFHHLRGQEKFESSGALTAQMEADQRKGEEIIANENPWSQYQEELVT